MKIMSSREITNKGRELMKAKRLDKYSIIVKISETELEEVYRQEVAPYPRTLIPPYSIEMYNNTTDIISKFNMIGFADLKGLLVGVLEDCDEILFKLKPITIIGNTYQTINVYTSEVDYILDRAFPVQMLLFPEQLYNR